MAVFKTKILVQTLDIVRGGQYATAGVRLPANAHTVTAIGVTTRPITRPFEVNYRYVGTGFAGERSADFVRTLRREFLENDSFQVQAGATQKIYYAQARRLGRPTFVVNGWMGGFLEAQVVWLIDGDTGLGEEHFLWESTNVNLGPTVVTVNQAEP